MPSSATDWSKPTAVYRLYDSAGKPLYIGMARLPERRFYVHSRRQPWWPEVASRSVTWHGNRYLADEAETIALAVERPAYNCDHKNAPSAEELAALDAAMDAAMDAYRDAIATWQPEGG